MLESRFTYEKDGLLLEMLKESEVEDDYFRFIFETEEEYCENE